MIEPLSHTRVALVASVALVSVGCAASPAVQRRAAVNVSARESSAAACVRPSLGDDSPYRLPLAGPVDDPELLRYLEDVPVEVRRILVATGLEPVVSEILRERETHPGTLTLSLLERQQVLASQLGALHSQLASVLFEVDCTGDAIEDLLHHFEQRARARELKLTIASLVVGAAAGVVAGVWDAKDREGNGPPITAAVGAGATALLGVSAFIPHEQRVTLDHERNLVSPIVRGEDSSHVYPTFVFRLLTSPVAPGQVTPRDELVKRWDDLLAQTLAPEQRAPHKQLLGGSGGVYSDDLLGLRQAMLDQLESRISALYRDLEVLQRYLARANVSQ
jgi:hypothetical protein